MSDPYKARIKLAEKIAAATGDEYQAKRLLLDNRDEIVKALMQPPAMAGPAEIETIENIVRHHFYPGPLSGSTTRLANALIAAYPALQGHEG